MEKEKLAEVLMLHKMWLNAQNGGVKADLRSADLRFADLRSADLRDANLFHANLQSASLLHANLRDANLFHANLQSANLRDANLLHADLRSADLQSANLRGADLDFSSLSLWCGVSRFKADIKFIYQLLAHVATIECDDPESAIIKAAIMPYAIKSHRAGDLGLLDNKED